jgi:uncharacterized ion transporter superfamily protein YfcC
MWVGWNVVCHHTKAKAKAKAKTNVTVKQAQQKQKQNDGTARTRTYAPVHCSRSGFMVVTTSSARGLGRSRRNVGATHVLMLICGGWVGVGFWGDTGAGAV